MSEGDIYFIFIIFVFHCPFFSMLLQNTMNYVAENKHPRFLTVMNMSVANIKGDNDSLS